MSILIIADHDGSKLSGATRCAVSAAARIGGPVDIVVAGHGIETVASQAAAIPGVARVLKADASHLEKPTAEALTALIVALAGDRTHVLFANTSIGKATAPRVAALLDVPQISDVASVVDGDTFVRPIYAGSVLATYRSREKTKVITVRMASFEAAPPEGGNATQGNVTVPPDPGISKVIGQEASKSDRPELTAARVVISGGRGLGSGENYLQLLGPLAGALNAALGASRAAVDAGYVPNDYQVGQTGKIIAPDLYIAIGISGAIQHLAGMKESKVIVAINKDPEAPIFQVADYGLVGDLFQVVPEFTQQIAQPAT